MAKIKWSINQSTSKPDENLFEFVKRVAQEHAQNYLNDWSPEDEGAPISENYIDTLSYFSGDKEIFVNGEMLKKINHHFWDIATDFYWGNV